MCIVAVVCVCVCVYVCVCMRQYFAVVWHAGVPGAGRL